MKLELGYDYWDCNCTPTRIHVKTGEVETYYQGAWSKSVNQSDPQFRGMSVSSDNTPIRDEADLDEVIRTYGR
jgi:hypothetical protein